MIRGASVGGDLVGHHPAAKEKKIVMRFWIGRCPLEDGIHHDVQLNR